MDERVIVLTRYGEPGKAKSRLIGVLGAEGAAELQCQMTAHTLAWAGRLGRRHDVSVEVRFEGGDRHLMQARYGTDLPFRPQGEGDLGQRMCRALGDAVRDGATRAVIVGSDCPGLTAELTRSALDRLADHEVVLGPAIDGGYYLIGVRGEVPELFSGIAWGTSEVLRQTLQAAARLGLSVAQLPPLADVDRPEDLVHWQPAGHSVAAERISVIIPTLDEAAHLGATLRRLRDSSDVETIVVDAGSTDQTKQIARAHGAIVLDAPRGRARQMNAAAADATGRILLFLHADTRLPHGFQQHIRRALARPGVIAGVFRLHIEGAGGSLRFIQRVANLRARYLHMPYGDQAIFLRREVFHSVGRFPELPILEDYELVRRLRRRGRIEVAEACAVTSARRWRALGPWRTWWINQMVVLGYRLGVSPKRLARWYFSSGV